GLLPPPRELSNRGGKLKMRRFTVIFLFLSSALPAGAKDIYVAAVQASSGTGSACSTARPVSWLASSSSWGSGATQVGPGTTVHLCGTITGTPGQQLFVIRVDGTVTSPITIK